MDEMIGKTYGRWKVLERVENKKGKINYKCECQCKNKTIKGEYSYDNSMTMGGG